MIAEDSVFFWVSKDVSVTCIDINVTKHHHRLVNYTLHDIQLEPPIILVLHLLINYPFSCHIYHFALKE